MSPTMPDTPATAADPAVRGGAPRVAGKPIPDDLIDKVDERRLTKLERAVRRTRRWLTHYPDGEPREDGEWGLPDGRVAVKPLPEGEVAKAFLLFRDAIPALTAELRGLMARRVLLMEENNLLHEAVRELHWSARRYCDGRSTYAVGAFNDITRKLLAADVRLDTPDGGPWARDGMGRAYDGLSDEEAASVRAPSAVERTAWARIEALEAENQRLRAWMATVCDRMPEDGTARDAAEWVEADAEKVLTRTNAGEAS